MNVLARAALVAVLALALAGCRARPVFDSPYPGEAPTALARGTLAEFAALLQARTRQHPHLARQGRVVIEVPSEGAKMWFEGNILVRDDPPAVRLRGSRVPIGTLFEVCVRGDAAWVYLNREREVFTGSARALRETTGLAGSVSLRELVASILVMQDLRERLARPGQWTMYRTRREVLLAVEEPGGRRLAWRIRRHDGLVREFVTFDARGAAELRVTYESWVLEDGEPLPGQFVAEVQDGAVRLTLRLDQYKLGQPIADAVFDELPRGAQSFFGLEQLAGRESVIPEGGEEAP